MAARAFTYARAMLRPCDSLRKPLHWHIQSLGELRDGLGGSCTAPTFEIGQITLANTCFEIQMQLRLAAPVTNGFQSTLSSKNRSTDLRGQHDAAGSQFGFPSIVNGDIVGILVIGAVEECLIFGPEKEPVRDASRPKTSPTPVQRRPRAVACPSSIAPLPPSVAPPRVNGRRHSRSRARTTYDAR
jgi:hypothetical protein